MNVQKMYPMYLMSGKLSKRLLYMIYLVPLTGADGGGELNVFGYQVSIYSRRTKEDLLEVGVTVLVMVVGLWPTTVCVSVLQLD